MAFAHPLKASNVEAMEDNAIPKWALQIKASIPPEHHKTAFALACPHDHHWLRAYFAISLSAPLPVLEALSIPLTPNRRNERDFYAYLKSIPKTQDLGFPESLNHTLHVLKEIHYDKTDPIRTVSICPIEPITVLPGFMSKFANAFTLELGDGHISSIAPLAFLNLVNIRIFNNPIKDLSPLWQLPSLRSLNLGGIFDLDLAQLIPLKNLRTLILVGDGIKNISQLNELKNLRFLNLASNLIEDGSALESLPNLRTLYLDNNPLVDSPKKRNRLRTRFLPHTELYLENASQSVYGTKKAPA